MKFPVPSFSVPGIYLDKIVVSEIEEIARFLGRHWFTDSPVSVILGMEGSPLEQQWMTAFVKSRLVRGIGIKAVKENGEIVGVILGHVTYKDAPDDPSKEELTKLTSLLPKMELNYKIFVKLFEGVDLFAKYGVDRYFNLGRGYVVAEYRGKGLPIEMATALSKEAQDLFEIQLFIAVPSGFRSLQMFKKSTVFQLISQVDYATFKVGDEYPFKNEGKDQSMELWATFVPLQPSSSL